MPSACNLVARLLGAGCFLWLIGCAAEPARMYNQDDEQDQICYGKLGGRLGYCDATRGHK